MRSPTWRQSYLCPLLVALREWWASDGHRNG